MENLRPSRPASRAVDAVIRCYQATLSPDHGFAGVSFGYGRCRFVPSCSAYALQAIRQYGLLRGGVVWLKRIVRCHPWNAGGYDPISNQQLAINNQRLRIKN